MQPICHKCHKPIDLNDCAMVVDAEHPIGIATHFACVDVGLLNIPAQPLIGYLCGTDWQIELKEPYMLGDCRISPNKEFARDVWGCTPECGLVEVEIRFVRWVIPPRVDPETAPASEPQTSVEAKTEQEQK